MKHKNHPYNAFKNTNTVYSRNSKIYILEHGGRKTLQITSVPF